MSIYGNMVDNNATGEDIERAENVMIDIQKNEKNYNRAGRFRIEDCDDDYITNEKTGKTIHIKPKDLYQLVINARANLFNNPRLNFLKEIPMFQKDIIFSYYKDTAWTDGCRLFMNPLFVHILSLNGAIRVNNFANSEDAEKMKKSEGEDAFADKCNRLQTSLIEFILLHEVYHVIYEHVRREYTKIPNPTEREHDKCNICADLEINRDIISFFPEYGTIKLKDTDETDNNDNMAEDIGMIWYQDERFYSKKGKPFTNEFFEKIYDNIKDDCTDVLEQDLNYSNERPEITTEENNDQSILQEIYDNGYKYGMDKIVNGEIDPLLF